MSLYHPRPARWPQVSLKGVFVAVTLAAFLTPWVAGEYRAWRTKQALERVLCQPCPSCTGSGMVKSVPTLCYEIQAEARKMAAADHEGPNLTLRVHPEIAKALKTRESMLIDELEQNSHKHVIIQSDATLHWEQYDIY